MHYHQGDEEGPTPPPLVNLCREARIRRRACFMVVADNLAPYLDKDMLNVGTGAMDVGFYHVLFWIC
jgi:hypothetical protein